MLGEAGAPAVLGAPSCYKRVPRETVCLFYKYICTALQSTVVPEATAPGRNLTNSRKRPSVETTSNGFSRQRDGRPSYFYIGVHAWRVWRSEGSSESQSSPSIMWILGSNSGRQSWWHLYPLSPPPSLSFSLPSSLFRPLLIFIYFLSQGLTL